MANDATLNMRGIEAVLDNLAQQSDKVQNRVARKAGLAGARVIVRKAKSLAPRKRGVLRRALVAHTSRKRTRPGVVVTALVRVRSGRKEARRVTKSGKSASRDAYYAGWVEFGHKIVRRGERRASIRRRRGRSEDERVKGYPFLEPAYASTQQQTLDAIAAEATKELAKP